MSLVGGGKVGCSSTVSGSDPSNRLIESMTVPAQRIMVGDAESSSGCGQRRSYAVGCFVFGDIPVLPVTSRELEQRVHVLRWGPPIQRVVDIEHRSLDVGSGHHRTQGADLP